MSKIANSTQPTTISRILKLLRLAEGVSARELARLLDLSPAYISAIETGRREPTLRVLNAYGAYFGISPATLLYILEENLLASNAELMVRIFEKKVEGEERRRQETESKAIAQRTSGTLQPIYS